MPTRVRRNSATTVAERTSALVNHYRSQAVQFGRPTRVARVTIHNPLLVSEPIAVLIFPEFIKQPMQLPANRMALCSIGFRPDDHDLLGVFGLSYLSDLNFDMVTRLKLGEDRWMCFNNDVVRWAIGLKSESQTAGLAICALSEDLQISYDWVDQYQPCMPVAPCS